MFDTNSSSEGGAPVEPQRNHECRLQRMVSEVDDADARSRYQEEAANNTVGDSQEESCSEEERRFVAWEPADPDNPYNWGKGKKVFILVTTMTTVINSTMASSLPSNATPYFAREWNISSTTEKILPISMFLIGYIVGPLIWAPLSEQYGRRWLSIGTFVMFFIWTMACGLAPSWDAFLIFRLLVGVFASGPVAIVTGIVADIYNGHRARGRAMAAFMATTLFGPLLSPIISGFCSPTIGWRWTFWVALIYAGLCLVPLLCLPETFGPVLLAQRAQRLRREDPESDIVAPHELEKMDLHQLAVRVLTRPLRMLFFELIVSASCVYLALVYAIFYMTFQSMPIIYEDMYGLSAGVEGLTFLSMGVGALLTLPIFFGWDSFLRRAQEENRPWTKKEECRRLPLACLGGPLFVIALFWLGWTARADVPFAVPMLSGIPFGMGFMLIFMALLNYLTDAYEIFAASANAAASCSRSLLATVLPFASTPMFTRLGISGACSLLGGLILLMCAIPFLFIWKGERLRAGSRFCIALQERKKELARRIEEQQRRDMVKLDAARLSNKAMSDDPKEEVVGMIEKTKEEV